jgi:hypothetical protein
MRLDGDRTLVISGGWRDRAGHWLRRAQFRFSGISGGVRITFPARRGDTVAFSVFADRPRAAARGIVDERAHTSLAPGPVRHEFAGPFASSDSSNLARATITTEVRRTGRLTVTVRALNASRDTLASPPDPSDHPAS